MQHLDVLSTSKYWRIPCITIHT